MITRATSRCRSPSYDRSTFDPPETASRRSGGRAHDASQALRERQVFMNALRSAPFLPVACLLHSRILSCCESAVVFSGAATATCAGCAVLTGVATAAGCAVLIGVATGSAACE